MKMSRGEPLGTQRESYTRFATSILLAPLVHIRRVVVDQFIDDVHVII